MGNICNLQERKRKVKFSASLVEMMSFNSAEDIKNCSININHSNKSTPSILHKRVIENLVEELYTVDSRENYLNARLLIQETFFCAKTVITFEESPTSLLPVSSILTAKKEKATVSKKVTNTGSESSLQNFGRQFKKCHKLSYRKFCKTLFEKNVYLPNVSATELNDQQLDHQNMGLAFYRALLYLENFDIRISTAFRRRKKALKKVRRAVLISYISGPSLGDKLFAKGITCNDSAYLCLAFYSFAAKVIEFTMIEIACLRLIYTSGQVVVNRRFWFKLFNLLYESADLFCEYWTAATSTSTFSLAAPSPKKEFPSTLTSTLSTTDRNFCSDVRLKALLGIEIRFLLESQSSLSEPLAEKVTFEVINFATVVLALPPKTGTIGVSGSNSRDLVWDDLIDDYYAACKGRRPYFYRRRSSK